MLGFMSDTIASDQAVLDLLRRHGRMTVSELESRMGVTATAVRQRLNRLMGIGDIQRNVDAAEGRGRPSHHYCLTKQGIRKAGANFADLAVALWEEIRSINDATIRRGLLGRLSARLADSYRPSIEGDNVADKMVSVAEMLRARRIPFDVEKDENGLPVLTALACPYPELAEKDRSICAMERMMFSELVDERLVLSQCRLDGESCCTFELQQGAVGSAVETIEVEETPRLSE